MNSHLIQNKGTKNNPGGGIPFYPKANFNWKGQTDVGEDYLVGIWAGQTALPPFQLWGTAAATVFNLIKEGGGTVNMLPSLAATVCLADGTKISTFNGGTPPASIVCGRFSYYVELGAAENAFYSETFNVIPNAELNGPDFTRITFRQSNGWLDHCHYLNFYTNSFYFKNRSRLARPVLEIEEDLTEDGYGNKKLTYALVREYIGASLLCPDYLLHIIHRIGLHNTITIRTGLNARQFNLTSFSAKDNGKADDYWHYVDVQGIIPNTNLNGSQCGQPPAAVIPC